MGGLIGGWVGWEVGGGWIVGRDGVDGGGVEGWGGKQKTKNINFS